MKIRRQHFVPEQYENLLLSTSAALVTTRFDQFVTASGIDPEFVFGDAVCTTPIPLYTKDDSGALVRFSGSNPEFMWHPLMWLPESLALRLQIREDAQVRLESDSEWSIRVALVLQTSGLYSADDGWLDILALHGLDVENPVDLARVEAWLAGATDETLDSVDLSEFIPTPGDDSDWSFTAAQQLSEVYVPAQWSLMAGSVLDLLETHVSPVHDSAEKRRMMGVLVPLAWDLLEDAPGASEFVRSPGDQLLGIIDALDEPGSDMSVSEEQLRVVLTEVRDNFAYMVEALDELPAIEAPVSSQ